MCQRLGAGGGIAAAARASTLSRPTRRVRQAQTVRGSGFRVYDRHQSFVWFGHHFCLLFSVYPASPPHLSRPSHLALSRALFSFPCLTVIDFSPRLPPLPSTPLLLSVQAPCGRCPREGTPATCCRPCCRLRDGSACIIASVTNVWQVAVWKGLTVLSRRREGKLET